jgi:hypothetical protein
MRKNVARWLAGLLIAYTVFGFLILPFIVKWVAVSQISRQLDRKTTIRRVLINPFVLSGTVRGLLVKDKDGEPFISVDEAYANFQISSFFGRAWVFKDVWTIRPYCRVQLNKDRSLNFSDLAAKFSQPSLNARPAKARKPLLLHVARLQIKGASASFTDLTPNTPFRRLIGPVEIMISNLRTDPNKKNPYSFAGTTDSGERFTWNGDFSLDPLQSAGELRLESLSLPKYAALFQDIFQFQINDCTVSGGTEYNLTVTGSNYVASITNATFHLMGLRISEKEHTNDVAELDDLKVAGVSANTSRRSAEVGAISVTGGRVFAERAADERINLLRLAGSPEDRTNAPGGIIFLMQALTNAYSALLQTTNIWTATVRDLQVTNCVLGWRDFAAPQPVSVEVSHLSVLASNLSNIPGPKQTLAVSLHWNTNGDVSVQSSLALEPLQSESTFSIHDLELSSLAPYLETYLNAFLLGSKVGASGTAVMNTGTNGLPQVEFRGDAKMDDFAAVDIAHEDLLKWKSVQLHGINAVLQPPAVSVDRMDIQEPNIRVAFDTNQALNFMTLMKSAPHSSSSTAISPAVRDNLDHKAVANAPRLNQRFGSIIKNALASQTNALGSSGAPKMSIVTTAITNGLVQFNDRSVDPPVKTSLDRICGTISGISSDDLKRADVALSAVAARTGPIEITGKINPLSQSAATELQVTLRDVDLTPESPYAGKYLGYRLNHGKLGLKVDYQVTNRRLKAKNILTIDNLTLGQKVRSPDATKLPVRLAVAILKDRNGRIELDVPIEGNLDDPTFHYGRAIVHVLGNIVTKLATAPFTALGSLFGGKGEDASYEDFRPGETELDPANVEKLEAFINGLYERPSLEVQIEGTYDPFTDRNALRKQKFKDLLRDGRWAKLRKSDQATTKASDITLEERDYAKGIEKAWAKLKRSAGANTTPLGTTNSPAAIETSPFVSDQQRGATVLLLKAAPPRKMAFSGKEQAVLETVPVSEAELLTLAKRRAQAVREKILEGQKIDASRLSLAEPVASANGTARVNFQLQ